MKDLLKNFLAVLHRNFLKPQGFKKERHTFSRDRGDYWERFNFQGSAVNYAGRPTWRFYLNVGIEFKNLPTRVRWVSFPHTHWAHRIDWLVPNAPQQWEYNDDTDWMCLAEEIARLQSEASVRITEQLENIRCSCVESK